MLSARGEARQPWPLRLADNVPIEPAVATRYCGAGESWSAQRHAYENERQRDVDSLETNAAPRNRVIEAENQKAKHRKRPGVPFVT